MKIEFKKVGDNYHITATMDNGDIKKRTMPKIAVDSIVAQKKLTEAGAVEYIAVHSWAGQEPQAPVIRAAQPRKVTPTPPAIPPVVKAIPPPPPPPAPPMPIEAPRKAQAKGKDDTLDDLLGELEGEVGDKKPDAEEEPKEEDKWDDYDWLLEQCRLEGYFGRPGSQSRKKEDLQKWLHKKLKR